MIKKLWIYLFGINDWTGIWKEEEEVLLYYATIWDGVQRSSVRCRYRIDYSYARNKYRLKCSGIGYKETETYRKALDLFNHYTNQLG